MTPTINIAVAGAGSTNVKATVSVNLSVALASLGMDVELRDGDPERHAARALTGGEPAARVRVHRGGPLRVDAMPATSGAGEPAAAATVLDCAPRLDAATMTELRAASVVLIPVDGSPLSLRALDEVASALVRDASGGREPSAPIRLLLSRSLPRSVDRWALVERLSERADTTLHPTTIPMGRSRRTAGVSLTHVRRRAATLYAPTTSAAKAYAMLARELVRDAGAQPDAAAR